MSDDRRDAAPGGWTRVWLILGLVMTAVALAAIVALSVLFDGLAGGPPSGAAGWPVIAMAGSAVGMAALRRRFRTRRAGCVSVLVFSGLIAGVASMLGSDPMVVGSLALAPVGVAGFGGLFLGLTGGITAFDRGAVWPALAVVLAASPVYWFNALAPGLDRAEPMAVVVGLALLLCVWPLVLVARSAR